MRTVRKPSRRRVVGLLGCCAAWALAGCESYQRAPLDLASYRDAVDARPDSAEPVMRFIERLEASGHETPAGFDLSDGVSLAEGEALALFYNPHLRLARAEAGVALAAFEHAGRWQDPEFGFDGAQILSPSSMLDYGLTVALSVPVSGRLGIEKSRAGAAHEAAMRGVVNDEWDLRCELRSAWAVWSAARAHARVAHDAVAQIEQLGGVTGALEAGGELSRVEGRLFRVETGERHAALAAARADEHSARLAVLGIMGMPPDAELELVESNPAHDQGDIDDALTRLIQRNTELATRRAEYRTAEEALRLEIRKQIPDITIGSGYGTEDSDDRLLLGFSVAIPVLNANRAGIAEARARRDVARAAAELTFERLSHELAAARASLESSRSVRARYEGEVAPLLDEQASEIERLAEIGGFDALLTLDATTRRVKTKANILEHRLQETLAAIEVARLLGPDRDLLPAPIADTQHAPPEHESPATEGGQR